MSATLAALATLVSRKRGDLEEVTTSAEGTTTTAICNTLVVGGDNEYAGDELLWPSRSGTPTRRVTSSDIDFNTLTFAPALSTLVAAGEAMEKRRKHLYADVVAAINEAIREIIPVAPQLAVPTSLSLVSEQYEYTIPATFVRVCTVEVDTDGDGTYETLEAPQWEMRPGRKLWIAENVVEDYAGYAIRLTGYTAPATLSTRTDSTPLPVSYILAYCDWYLLAQKDGVPPTLLDVLYKLKEFERSRAMTQLLPNTRLVKP